MSARENRPEHEPLPGAMYFTIGGHGGPALGYVWRLWSGGTSFYMKSSYAGMRFLKLSVHGDDPRHPSGGGFKLGMDTEEAWTEALASGAMIGGREGEWPIWFPGRQLNENATLVARMRWTYDAVSRLGPAPEAKGLKKDAKGLAAPAPSEPGYATDIDLIVSRTLPYWREEPEARKMNGCMGPLHNKTAGLWLTGTVVRRWIPHYPHPRRHLGPMPTSRADQARGVGAGVDASGFLWLIEHRVSRTQQSD